MKKLFIGMALLATVAMAQQSPVPQPDPLTVEKLAEKFVQEHAAEEQRCLVLRVQYDQINDQNVKLIKESENLKKQIADLIAKEAKK